MKKATIIFQVITIAAIFLLAIVFLRRNDAPTEQNDQPAVQNIVPQTQSTSNNVNQNTTITAGFQAPLDRASERVTKKPFGIYITPATSPVQPERFQGYHTGTDFEIFPEELNIDVPVHAVCSGKLLLEEYASGYGGVAVESCELENNAITVIYGHLKLSSISSKTGDVINAGDTIGILGKGYSAETNGERKHLHLGFHKGTAVNIKGYVNAEADLYEWIDSCEYVCHN